MDHPVLRATTVPGDLLGGGKKNKGAAIQVDADDADRFFAEHLEVEAFLDEIPERTDHFPTLIMFNAKTGEKRRKRSSIGCDRFWDITWPLFFWFDMLRNLWQLIKGTLYTVSGFSHNFGPAVLALIVLAYPFAYGWYIVGQGTTPPFHTNLFDMSKTEFRAQTNVFFARSFGKACTVSNLIGVLFITKAVSTMWDTIPHDKRPVGWRKLHIWFCQSIFLFGCVHGIAHGYRVFRNDTIVISRTWETLLLVSGVTLAFILLLMNLPYAFLRSGFWTRRYGLQFKKFFRYSHRFLFLVFELLYLVHSTSFAPVVLIVIWFYSLKSFELAVERFGFRFLYKSKAHGNEFVSNKVIPHSQGTYVLELKVRFHEEIPVKYGYYCVIKFGSINASYTMIPLDSKSALFRIQKCALTEAIKNQLGKLSYIEVNSVYAKPSSQFTKLDVFGPYLSGDYNTGNSKKVCVLVSGTGNAVSDALALFNSARKQYWKSLTILNAGSRQLDDQYYAIQGIPCVALPDTLYLENTDQLHYYATTPRKPFVNLINVDCLNVKIVRQLMLALKYQGFSIVICSAMWRGLVDKVIEQDPIMAAEYETGFEGGSVDPQIVHIEDFEIA